MQTYSLFRFCHIHEHLIFLTEKYIRIQIRGLKITSDVKGLAKLEIDGTRDL